jgi:2-hydroxychromene-2-carboxylate isomerase
MCLVVGQPEAVIEGPMSETTDASSIRFYFSFRSPYAWIAAERLDSELRDLLDVPIEPIPIFPTPELFPNDPSVVPNKVAYLLQDVPRLARERGLSVRFPSAGDPDWALSHAAFLGAESQGAGQRFMVAVFRKRFCQGLDLGDDRVLAEAARESGLDPEAILSAAHSETLRAEVSSGWRLAVERDRIFGVPSFAYAGKLYWGQDRMHFLRSAVIRKSARPED